MVPFGTLDLNFGLLWLASINLRNKGSAIDISVVSIQFHNCSLQCWIMGVFSICSKQKPFQWWLIDLESNFFQLLAKLVEIYKKITDTAILQSTCIIHWNSTTTKQLFDRLPFSSTECLSIVFLIHRKLVYNIYLNISTGKTVLFEKEKKIPQTDLKIFRAIVIKVWWTGRLLIRINTKCQQQNT